MSQRECERLAGVDGEDATGEMESEREVIKKTVLTQDAVAESLDARRKPDRNWVS